MPRWLFLVFAVATALSVLGSVLIVLRSPNSTPPLGSSAPPPSTPRAGANP